ncbi:MAG: glycine zipper domain-containing protein [Pirellulaceae bacterium]|nr:hypothetical protein [Planctomycetales bacterium]MCA9165561.1 hypothetical protein [Planctomycetales bacterium]
MNRRWMPLSLMFLGLAASMAHGQGFTEKGAAIGGIAGALGGAAIGKNNKDTAAGALIGGALGLVTGAAIGNAKDNSVARSQAQYQQQQYYAQQMSRAVSSQDVINMARSGLSDSLIIGHIQQNGVQRRLEVSDVITLHQYGVSEPVISAMQRAPLASAVAAPPAPAPVVAAPSTVIVEERYIAPPIYYRPYYYHPPHYHRYHRPPHGMSGRVTFGF